MFPSEVEFFFISNQTCMPYAISYHNKNNVEILEKYCKLIRKICPWVNYYSPRLAEKMMKKQPLIDKYEGYKKRICFISDSFATDTSVLRDRVSIIGKLDRNLYEVWFGSFIPFENITGNVAKLFMTKIKNNYIYLGKSLENARTVLESFKFDYLVYPDIGMKLPPTLLAYSRIAPIQITTWGHSETSGIDTIDYFISSKYFELEDTIHQPQMNYSEKLIMMDSLSTFYISPNKLFIELNEECKDKKFKTKEELGFQTTDNLYSCLQTFYKINPDFEYCLARILELDPNGIILLSNTYPYCKSHLARLKKILGEAKINRIRFYGSLDKSEFLNLVSISSVCLDPFPFGGCNTSYDAFDYNIPVITMPSEFLHGRFTYGLYKKMGLDECIVSNSEEFAQIAVSISINDKLRNKIQRNIEMKKSLIFQEQESVNEWNKLFTYLE
jgi:protein O-GlcNAc transferase